MMELNFSDTSLMVLQNCKSGCGQQKFRLICTLNICPPPPTSEPLPTPMANELREKGMGKRKNKADSLSVEDEEALWKSGTLGTTNPLISEGHHSSQAVYI